MDTVCNIISVIITHKCFITFQIPSTVTSYYLVTVVCIFTKETWISVGYERANIVLLSILNTFIAFFSSFAIYRLGGVIIASIALSILLPNLDFKSSTKS